VCTKLSKMTHIYLNTWICCKICIECFIWRYE